MINTTIQNYKIVSKIGEGGMGAVYLAQDTMLDKNVAIKVLNPTLTQDTLFIERFKQEAKLQASLEHPNIVSIYNLLKDNDVYFIVMQYAEGITLKDLIQMSGPINEKRALDIFEKILDGLNYAHKRNIIHRDIKPVNIIIGFNDHVKIMDFGIAKLLGNRGLTGTGKSIGTPFYMSPEQIRAIKDIDQRTDLYSAGITLFEMLTAKLPFNTDTDSDYELMKEIVENNIPDPRSINPQLSEDISAIIKKLTEKDLSKRFKSCDDCVSEIKRREAISQRKKKDADETVIDNLKTVRIENKEKVPEEIQKTSLELNKDIPEKKTDKTIREQYANKIHKEIDYRKDYKGIGKKFYIYAGSVLVLIILTILIINFSGKGCSDKKDTPNIIEQSKSKLSKETVKDGVNSYLGSLYAGNISSSKDSLELSSGINLKQSGDLKIDGIYNEGYDPFSKAYKDSESKLSPGGISSDDLVNYGYIFYFTLVGAEDSIKAKLIARTMESENVIVIKSIEYLDILPINNERASDKPKEQKKTPIKHTPKPKSPEKNTEKKTGPIVRPPK